VKWSFRKLRLEVNGTWTDKTYTGANTVAATTTVAKAGEEEFFKPRLILFTSVSYRLTSNLSLFVAGDRAYDSGKIWYLPVRPSHPPSRKLRQPVELRHQGRLLSRLRPIPFIQGPGHRALFFCLFQLQGGIGDRPALWSALPPQVSGFRFQVSAAAPPPPQAGRCYALL